MAVERYDLVGDASNLLGSIKDVVKVLNGDLARAQGAANKRLETFTGNAKAAGKAVDTKGGGLGNKLGGLKKAADGAAGKVGEIAGRMQNFGEAASALASPLGLALVSVGALVVGIGALAGSVVSTIVNIEDLESSLIDLGVQSTITMEQRESIENAGVAFDALRASVTRASISLGAEFAPEAEGAADAITSVVDALGEMVGIVGSIGRFTLAIVTLGGATTALAKGQRDVVAGTLRWVGIMDGATASTKDAISATNDLANARVALGEDTAFLAELERVLAENAREDADAQRERAKAAKKAADERIASEDDKKAAALLAFKTGQEIQKQNIAGINEERASRERLAGETAKQFAEANALGTQRVADERTQADEREQIIEDTIDASDRLVEQLGRLQDELRATAEDWVKVGLASADAIASTAGDIAGFRAEQLAEQRDALEKALDDEISLRERAASGDARIGKKQLRRNKRILEQRKKDLEKAERNNFRVQKATRIAQAIVNTATAVTSALTIPPPAGQILAGVVGAAGASEIALIAAEEPKFHLGTDEVAATLRAEEAVLNPGGANIVGREKIDAANRGDTQAAAADPRVEGAPIPWRRFFDEMIAEALGGDGRSAGFLPTVAAQRSPYSG